MTTTHKAFVVLAVLGLIVFALLVFAIISSLWFGFGFHPTPATFN